MSLCSSFSPGAHDLVHLRDLVMLMLRLIWLRRR